MIQEELKKQEIAYGAKYILSFEVAYVTLIEKNIIYFIYLRIIVKANKLKQIEWKCIQIMN